ncbi:sorting nexin-25-like isoform X1 [Mytilus californianus]|uniref:sorting nexin-25-like isoform X1 n=1 Tax=Mytilus californianus TaxID=6549 RepID=UPI002246D02D|nr:sorting nexin-25-like isoform X1 [Mytilus californianus]XP_052089464.1 sorting nexin-25-like isoform X1 [Mytilus californianus]
MNTREIIFMSVAISIAAVFQYYDWLFISLFLMFMTAVGVLGIYLSVSWSLVRGKQYKPSSQPTEPANIKELLEKMMEKKSETLEEQKKVVVSRNIDNAVREVMDFVIRDFILSWYTELSVDQTTATNAIKNDMWVVLENLSTRLSKIDKVKVMTQDVMELTYQHFNKIRLCSASKGPDQRKFILHAWLANEDTELEFLRKLCDAFLIVLLPSHYRGCISLRHLLREILTGSVVKPAVDMLCDPDYINRKLISYIDYRQRLSEDTKKTYTYAATYEDFIKLIDKCNDIEQLKQIRYNILTEIIHATTIDNLKKEQGPISDRTSPTPGIGKGELLKARNLKRYTNQLSVAKTKSEKRLHYLGGPEYKAYDLQDDTMETSQKVLTFQEIMDSPSGREEFSRYLKRTDSDSLMGFWNSVEKLKNMDKKLQHHQASEIYQQYIASSNSIVKLDKTIIKGMEAFMLGNQGPEKFYEGQVTIEHILQTQHYPSFLVSDIYNRYVRSLEDGTLDAKSDSAKDYLLFEPKDHFVDPEDEDEEMFASQSYEAQARLQQLDEKIENKTQALHAMRATKTTAADDSKKEKVEKEIEKELENLEMEKRMREAHILRTRTWIENQGQWRVHVYGAELVEEQDKKILVYVLVVYLTGGDEGSQNLQNSSNGWTVSRNLAEFHTLNEQLCQIGPWLKKKDIPSAGRFTTIDDKFIEESKKTLSSYLEVILKDERMAHSEALYAFLSPSPEYFKQNKLEKSNFFLRTLLKKFPSRQPEPHDSDDELLFGREEETKLDRNVDSIAEPFYKLVNEIFESRGMFKWLRKSFIMFVEVTFGRTINRQLCETVDWIFSESMIIYYIQQFTLSMWPDGKLAENESSRSDEEKLKTRMEAKEKFLQNMPDAIKTLLGEDNGRRGTIKIFEVLQDTRLNKQLFYDLVNLLTLELCPEIKNKKPFVPDATKETKF